MSVYSVAGKDLKLNLPEYTSGFFGHVTSSGLVINTEISEEPAASTSNFSENETGLF